MCRGRTATPAHPQPLSDYFSQGRPQKYSAAYLYSLHHYSQQTSNLRAAGSTVSSLCTWPLPPIPTLTFDCVHVIVRFVFWFWTWSLQHDEICLQMRASFFFFFFPMPCRWAGCHLWSSLRFQWFVVGFFFFLLEVENISIYKNNSSEASRMSGSSFYFQPWPWFVDKTE